MKKLIGSVVAVSTGFQPIAEIVDENNKIYKMWHIRSIYPTREKAQAHKERWMEEFPEDGVSIHMSWIDDEL